MVAWLSSWAQGIIVAVIVSTIIETILPNGNIKKYVRVVIGIYILFTIISPMISIFGKVDIKEQIFNTTEYEEQISKSSNLVSQQIENNNTKTIKDIYISNLEKDIKSKLDNKGYDVLSIYIKAKDDSKYSIEKIELNIKKQEDNANNLLTTKNNNSVNEVTIEKIKINVGTEENKDQENLNKENILNNNTEINEQTTKISNENKKEIIEYLSSIYELKEENIEIS